MPTAEGEGARRVLVTGLSTYWGGRLAHALESNPEIEAIIGVDSKEPTRELERTEYVKVGAQHGLIEKIVRAARIDTVVDTRLMVDSERDPSGSRPDSIHENNVIGTLNILAACSAADSPVRRLVFKSSAHWYGCAQDDPAFFAEDMVRTHPPATPIERDLVEAEAAVDDFRRRRPEVTVSVLRFANVLGAEVDTSHVHLFSLPLVPIIAGFDPRYQFVDEIDVVHALEHVTINDLPGVFNVAGDGVLTLTETISLLGKRPLPALPPWGTGLAASAARRLGISIPDEMINQLRFGRGLDNRLFKSTGFHYRRTSRESVIRLRERLRLNPVAAGVASRYRYEPEVEEFLRHSPHVIREPSKDVGREDAAMFDPSPPVQE
ncbi:MAG TPA: NAD-dependent epimerase/dehydratase family protein [Solirubrobacterales bacterium]|nr:NAD-dependent epimerase/dehydratase family protein [Solirubrobacterales bacterium]